MIEREEGVEERAGIDLQRLWLVIIRHWWSILLLPVLVMMIVWLYNGTLTPVYRATGTMLVERTEPSSVSIEEALNPGQRSLAYLGTQFELLRSRSMAERVVDDLGLVTHPDLDPRQQTDDPDALPALTDWRGWLDWLGLADQFPMLAEASDPEEPPAPRNISEAAAKRTVVAEVRSALTVSPRGETSLVNLSVEHPNPELAARLVNAFMQAYVERQLEARMAMSRTATAWMSRRLDELRGDLNSAEQELQAFREAEGIVDLGGASRLSADGLTQLNNQLVQARQALVEAENRYEQIADMPADDWRQQLTAAVVRSDGQVSSLRSAELQARSVVDELAERYGPKHPTMLEAREELNIASSNLRGAVESVVASIRTDYDLAVANLQSLEASVAEYSDRTRDAQAQDFTLSQLEREVEVARTLYESFLARLREISAVEDLEQPNAEVVDEAQPPGGAFKPHKLRNTQIAGGLTLILAIGLAFLREQLNMRILGSGDAEEKLGMPILGLLPRQSGKSDIRKTARLFLEGTDRVFSEAVRTIRTGIVLSHLDDKAGVTLITSSLPGEGKTATSVNLSYALGAMERVLLLEVDLRRPSFRRIFNLPDGTPGLTDVLGGGATLEQAIRHENGIDVLAGGTLPPNPLDLLSSERFQTLIDDLRQRYDRVILDAPPVQVVSDPVMLATMASAVVYIVRAETTTAPVVRRGVKRLAMSPGRFTGIVLNYVDVNKSARYGYGQAYRYGEIGYYDYYGYSSGPQGR